MMETCDIKNIDFNKELTSSNSLRLPEKEPLVKKYFIDTEKLDYDAINIIKRLKSLGFDAFLVGGCIRDILLDKLPKDYDIVTSASPVEIRKIFRNSRLIGRRFRLAHIYFKNRKIIEVATFRRGATSDDDLTSRHAEGNLFGTAAEDAIRRDFTINALMYDVEDYKIYDWTGGLADINKKILRSIGDPDVRIAEDPVRIIRAAKFAEKLDLQIEPQLAMEMTRKAHLIPSCSNARLVEELFKILKSGFSCPIFKFLYQMKILQCILPQFAKEKLLEGDLSLFLEQIDKKKDGFFLSEPVLVAVLTYPLLKDAMAGSKDISKDLSLKMKTLMTPIIFPRNIVEAAKHLLISMHIATSKPGVKFSKKLSERENFSQVIDLMEITRRVPLELIKKLRKRAIFISQIQKEKPPKRRKVKRYYRSRLNQE